MGMTYTSFGLPLTTKNLQANADLNLGTYDLLCTDAKGDTAEFTEFVGGVGNFSNVLGSGNLDIEGTASIKGNTQIDGNLVLEGAINNVNIADNGEITTSQGVNGADFNGAVITSNTFNGVPIKSSGVITVTPAGVSRWYKVPLHQYGEEYKNASLTLLPYKPNCVYSGNIAFEYIDEQGSNGTLYYWTDDRDAPIAIEFSGSGVQTYTFESIAYLVVTAKISSGTMFFSPFILS